MDLYGFLLLHGTAWFSLDVCNDMYMNCFARRAFCSITFYGTSVSGVGAKSWAVRHPLLKSRHFVKAAKTFAPILFLTSN